MTAIDFHRTNARIVNQLEDRVAASLPSSPLYLSDVLALADSMTSAGFDPGETVAHIDAIQTAVNAAISGDTNRWLNAETLLNLTPEDIGERVRQAGIDRATYIEQQNVRNGMESTLARAAAQAMAQGADEVIKGMREKFDPAAVAVQHAADVGLTQFTDTTTLLDTAAPAVIEAYRALGPAVATLNSLMGLRNQMTTVLGAGPASHPMAAYVTGVRNLPDLEGAQNVWRGETEVVQHQVGVVGTHLATVRAKQLGGGWLALVCAGYSLRLNTGAEALAVVTAAHAGDAE